MPTSHLNGEALGDDWERIHETLLHTLGNLTLTGYNWSTATTCLPKAT